MDLLCELLGLRDGEDGCRFDPHKPEQVVSDQALRRTDHGVPDADVEKYYNAHPEEFNQKDQVRVSQILLKDKAKADKVAAEVKALSKVNMADQKAFRDLVTKYSEDEDSKPRGGDLTFIDKDTQLYPKPIVEGAFSLKEVGDVVTVKTDKGFHILKLTQKRPGFSRPMAPRSMSESWPVMLT